MDPNTFIQGFQSNDMKNRLLTLEKFLIKLKQKPTLNDIPHVSLINVNCSIYPLFQLLFFVLINRMI
jgi:hypothetical protein